ncbi:MAG: class I SAM-dependent methyltransferase [Pseudomonadota bacterium]
MAGCRFCGTPLDQEFVDLGLSPLCQKHVDPEDLAKYEVFYPLKVWVCTQCWLVQTEDFVEPEELFADYEYFSSYSPSWVEHAANYVAMITERFHLGAESRVVEIACNDGYLLKNFVDRQIPALGIEPAANVAKVAAEKGITVITDFFGEPTARHAREAFGAADLIIGNNVLAHVPDINDFVNGLSQLLAAEGVVTMEFPHLVRLVEENQFDTIYHEHYSYLALHAVQTIFGAHGLRIFDVEQLATHGGSLRVYAALQTSSHAEQPSVQQVRSEEVQKGYLSTSVYDAFRAKVIATKQRLLAFLIDAKQAGQVVVGYGAPGKGNTLLNYCGIRTDFIDYTVDRSPYKQGRYTPGARLPIYAPEKIRETRPDYVLILPWNLRNEISESHAYIRDWGGKFVVPIPTVEIF